MATQRGWEQRAVLLAAGIAIAACGSVPAGTDSAPAVGAYGNWPIWGADAGGTKYSHLDQINRANVAELMPVWTWETGEQPVGGPRAPVRGDVRPAAKRSQGRPWAEY